MLEIFQSSVWQFVGAVLALLAVVIPISIYLKQRRRKTLSYIVLSSTDLLSVQEEIKGQIKILFNDDPVESVRLYVIKLVNSGNTSITKDDYEHPVSIEFGKNAKVLSYEVTDKVPDNLPAEIYNREER